MNITLRITDTLHNELFAMADSPVETAAVLIAKLIPLDSDQAVLLGTALVPVPEEAYEVRTGEALQITSDGYVHSLKTARDQGAVAIWVHSHPGNGSLPNSSRHDRRVNAQLAPLFGAQTESDEYGYLIVSHDDGALTFTGALAGPVEGSIKTLSAIGPRWRFRRAHDAADATDYDLFDRNIRAFGSQIQDTIAALTVAIVGNGGTGSAVGEQLARLGVRSFILVDPDVLSSSNTTRVYGSTPADVERPKVDVLGDHLERIADGVTTTRIHGTITDEAAARVLRAADLVFGCTDDNAGRLRISRLPYYYLTPVIDVGIQLHADEAGFITGIFGRVTTLYAGAACLICRDRIDLRLADAEVRPPDEQQRLEKEGYAPSLPGVEPAVVAFTTLVAATATGELLERLVGYGDTPTPSELILYIHDRAVRGNVETPRPGHYCDPTVNRIGTDADMFLGVNWAS
jgi:hypothetical protein